MESDVEYTSMTQEGKNIKIKLNKICQNGNLNQDLTLVVGLNVR